MGWQKGDDGASSNAGKKRVKQQPAGDEERTHPLGTNRGKSRGQGPRAMTGAGETRAIHWDGCHEVRILRTTYGVLRSYAAKRRAASTIATRTAHRTVRVPTQVEAGEDTACHCGGGSILGTSLSALFLHFSRQSCLPPIPLRRRRQAQERTCLLHQPVWWSCVCVALYGQAPAPCMAQLFPRRLSATGVERQVSIR